jgi:hypothetical protein
MQQEFSSESIYSIPTFMHIETTSTMIVDQRQCRQTQKIEHIHERILASLSSLNKSSSAKAKNRFWRLLRTIQGYRTSFHNGEDFYCYPFSVQYTTVQGIRNTHRSGRVGNTLDPLFYMLILTRENRTVL